MATNKEENQDMYNFIYLVAERKDRVKQS